jgi:hypothetical protein
MTASCASQPSGLGVGGDLARQGTWWLVEFDLAGLLAGLGIDPGTAETQEAVVAAEQEALAHCTRPPVEVPGRCADLVPAGPGLAAYLASADTARCADEDLPVVAAGFRRLAAWAQASELAAVAEIAARTAARTDRADDMGQPVQVQPEAAAEVSLALTMSQPTAADWTGLAIRLRWQLPATAAALGTGAIDLPRARLIAEATAALPDQTARAVEERVLPAAGQQTTGQLRAALRRAVIAADPDGADRRRERAERQAKVTLYPDAEGTATLAGSALPAVRAAAAMARITALARAMKAAGTPGGLDHLRAYVMLGLLLGTLTPPAPAAPPDNPPAPPDDPPPAPPDNPPAAPPADPRASPDNPPAAPAAPPDNPRPASPTPPADAGDNAHCASAPASPAEVLDPAPPADTLDPAPPADTVSPAPPAEVVGPARPADTLSPAPPADTLDPAPPADTLSPAQRDSPARSPEPDDRVHPVEPPDLGTPTANDADSVGMRGAPATWPVLPASLPSSALSGTHDNASGRPPPGLLDVLVPWSALTRTSGEPAVLGRIGPVTPLQARELLDLATGHPGTQWRVVLTDSDGHAEAVERVRESWRSAVPVHARAGPGTTVPVIGRVTVTIPADEIGRDPDSRASRARLPSALRRAANRAASSARATRLASAAAGGCVHLGGTAVYRPSPRLREFVAARDLTCTFPTCGQPAWRADLDHTVPWHRGGPTCACNLGGRCRTHHKIKQLPGWKLDQTPRGTFRWTTPAGRIYPVEPHRYPS